MTATERLTFACLGAYTILYCMAYAATCPSPASPVLLACALGLHVLSAIPGTTLLAAPLRRRLRNRARRALPVRAPLLAGAA